MAHFGKHLHVYEEQQKIEEYCSGMDCLYCNYNYHCRKRKNKYRMVKDAPRITKTVDGVEINGIPFAKRKKESKGSTVYTTLLKKSICKNYTESYMYGEENLKLEELEQRRLLMKEWFYIMKTKTFIINKSKHENLESLLDDPDFKRLYESLENRDSITLQMEEI